METVSVYLMKEKEKRRKRRDCGKKTIPELRWSMFVFALMWSVGATVDSPGRDALSDFIKNFIQDNTILEKRNL